METSVEVWNALVALPKYGPLAVVWSQGNGHGGLTPLTRSSSCEAMRSGNGHIVRKSLRQQHGAPSQQSSALAMLFYATERHSLNGRILSFC